ncbi:MAG: hypothetical protein P8127_17115, partial [Acidobacteriota bacterium]
ILLGMVAPFAAQRVDEVPSWVFFVLSGLLLAAGVATLWAVVKGHDLGAAVAPGIAFAVVYLFVSVTVYPMANAFKSGREFAGIIAEETAASRAAGHEVLAFDLGNLPIHYAFYTDGVYTIETNDSGDLARHLDAEDRVFAIANADRLDELPPKIRDEVEIIATTSASRRNVALIANRSPSG